VQEWVCAILLFGEPFFLTLYYSDDCRFPHIITEGSNAPPYFPGKGGFRSRGGHANANGIVTINEKLETLTLKDVCIQWLLTIVYVLIG
jgi:hypothetical protein